jgi:hypothetical protein
MTINPIGKLRDVLSVVGYMDNTCLHKLPALDRQGSTKEIMTTMLASKYQYIIFTFLLHLVIHDF